MVKVNIAWSRPAAEIAENKGFEALSKSKNSDLTFETKEFANKEIAFAYLQGISDANGWDDPWTQIDAEEAEATYIVASSHGPTLDNSVDNFSVFRGEDGNSFSQASEEYDQLLTLDTTTLAVLALVVKSTDY